MRNKTMTILLVGSLTVLLVACSGAAKNQAQVGVIAIGHSGMTGFSSGPNGRGSDAPENSWATGTAPEVNSVYQRLVAVRPETAGHVANLAKDGATATALADQARAALLEVPTPELVLIQTIDNDIRCDGTDPANLDAFGAAIGDALNVVAEASPKSHILLLSQFGRPATFAATLESNPGAIAQFFAGSGGMCDLFNLDGSPNPEGIASLTAIIESYEAEEDRVCAAVPQCSRDGGAFAGMVDDLADWVPGDWNHLNVHGHARLAETIWPTVAELLGVGS